MYEIWRTNYAGRRILRIAITDSYEFALSVYEANPFFVAIRRENRKVL